MTNAPADTEGTLIFIPSISAQDGQLSLGEPEDPTTEGVTSPTMPSFGGESSRAETGDRGVRSGLTLVEEASECGSVFVCRLR